jgi:hypothetical protein
MKTQTQASWIFGTLFVLFVLAVFSFGPTSLPGYKQQLLAYICALLAGCFALFFTGTLLVHAELPIPGKWTVKGGAGLALFLIVLFWWNSPNALIARSDASTSHAAKGPDSSPRTPPDPSPPRPSPRATLQKVSIIFSTLNDDKDSDMGVDVYLTKGQTTVAGATDIAHNLRFDEASVSGPYNIPIFVHVAGSDFAPMLTHIAIHPNGPESWKAQAVIQVEFSDGNRLSQRVQFGLGLDYGPNEQAFPWNEN